MQTKIKKLFNRKQSGFTLIEILVAIGLIALLAAIVIIAINPARQFAQGRNTQRTSNVNTILNAIGQKIADSKGTFAGAVVGVPGVTCPTLTVGTTYNITSVVGGNNIDLSCLVPTYIPSAIPFDPDTSLTPTPHWTDSGNYETQYQVTVDANGRFTVTSPHPELGATISITR